MLPPIMESWNAPTIDRLVHHDVDKTFNFRIMRRLGSHRGGRFGYVVEHRQRRNPHVGIGTKLNQCQQMDLLLWL